MDNKDFDWFSFYPRRIHNEIDELDHHMAGIFLRLLLRQWGKGSISKDLPNMDDLITITGEIISIENPTDASSNPSSGASSPLNIFGTNATSVVKIRLNREAIWDILKDKFTETAEGRFQYEQLEKERAETQKRLERHAVNKANGSKGGKKSVEVRKAIASDPSSPASTDASSLRQPTLEATPEPITEHYIINLKEREKGDLEKKGKLVGNLQKVLADVDGLLAAGFLQKADPDFAKFVVEKWANEVLEKADEMTVAQLKKDFANLAKKQTQALVKEFNLAYRDDKWFMAELQRVAIDMQVTKDDEPYIKSFRDHYMALQPTGEMYFQTQANFVMDSYFRLWLDDKRKRRGNYRVKKGSEPAPQKKATTPPPQPPKPVEQPKPDVGQFDREIKQALNKFYRKYVESGLMDPMLGAADYQFLLNYGADLPSADVIESQIKPKIMEQRKKEVFHRAENYKSAEEGKLYHNLKKMYTEGTLSIEEQGLIHRSAYLMVIQEFFEKMKTKSKNALYDNI